MDTLDTATPSDTTLVVRRTYDAPRERVFDAWLDPRKMRIFFSPEDVTCTDIAVDPRVGGAYSLTMNTSTGPFVVRGRYVELRRPERLSFTWSWDEDDPALQNESQVSLDFFERDGKTELVLTHERLLSVESRDRHTNGWTSILQKMDALVPALARPFSILGIDLSGYMVQDGKRATAFYRDVLGLEPTTLYPEDRGAEYELSDGTVFGLWGGGGKVIPFQPSNGVLFTVDDYDAAVAALHAREIPILTEIDLPGCRMAAIADPEGNTVFLHARKRS